MKKTHLTPSLYQTAKDIVNIKSLDYIGIMIACLEDDGALPIYAHYIDPDVADENWIKSWEEIVPLLRKTCKSIRSKQHVFTLIT